MEQPNNGFVRGIRSPEEIMESVSHGLLYYVSRIHAGKVIVFRARRDSKRGKLVMNTNERRVFLIKDLCRVPRSGDLIFIDSTGEKSLWSPPREV